MTTYFKFYRGARHRKGRSPVLNIDSRQAVAEIEQIHVLTCARMKDYLLNKLLLEVHSSQRARPNGDSYSVLLQ